MTIAIATISTSQQQTLAAPIAISGIGLHSGATVNARLCPAAVGDGRYFVRVDQANPPRIPATIESVGQTLLSTELKQGVSSVRTVEHLLAALSALGITNARLELDGPEVPLLDGSAQAWVEAIVATGTTVQSAPVTALELLQPLWVRQDDAFVTALPASTLRLTYGIDFPHLPAIGSQWHSLDLSPEQFQTELAGARTFGFAAQIDALRSQGLIKGGSLENALVCGSEGWLNPPLRFANEPVRHKLLDLVGDLSLLGYALNAHVLAYKASHALHTQFVEQLLQGVKQPVLH
ncbi:MAG: UDP-3-O-acyl-N-acetylglucosamine deacetylase [Cyanobacteria bacterium P01_H01_bin.121]